MTRLPQLTAKELIKILAKIGFEIRRQSGTHIILRKGNKTVVVPIHKEIMPIGTLKSIERQAEIKFKDL